MPQHNKLNTVNQGKRHHHAHDHSHDHEDDEEIEEVLDSTPVIIFDAHTLQEEVPQGFNAVKIAIDGSMKADLSWKEERAAALRYTAHGLKIFWEINLGLFSSLKHPLGNQAQFLSLCLSLEHFRDTLWKEFRTQTVGLCFYRGRLDLSSGFAWDETQIANMQGWLHDRFGNADALAREVEGERKEFSAIMPLDLANRSAGKRLLSLFCCDAVGEYLDLLANRLPDTLPLFVLFDATGVDDPLLTAQLLHKERYPRLCLGVKGGRSLGGELSWEGSPLAKGTISRHLSSQSNVPVRIAVCLPSMQQCRQADTLGLNEALAWLQKAQTPFRIIPEGLLTTDWDGLDQIIAVSHGLSPQGKRKLQGFCAAGGEVLTIGAPIGLPQESSWQPHDP